MRKSKRYDISPEIYINAFKIDDDYIYENSKVYIGRICFEVVYIGEVISYKMIIHDKLRTKQVYKYNFGERPYKNLITYDVLYNMETDFKKWLRYEKVISL